MASSIPTSHTATAGGSVNPVVYEQQDDVWIIDDDKSIRWVLEKALDQANLRVKSFENGESAKRALQDSQPLALISDIRMPGIDGLALLQTIHRDFPDLPVIIMTAHSDLESAVASYQGGAFEYLPKPFDVDDVVQVARRALEQAHQRAEAQRKPYAPGDSAPPADIIGEAPAMQEVFRAIGRLSHSNITVLINGESGTGKELVAHALHRHSPRAKKPFIALNMAAVPKDLMESELFGHEKGAFTGALSQRQGRFEQADGGTLFLDEIGDMPHETQTRLLRVLADGMFYRVGGHTPVKVDVRIVAATHQDLETRVKEHQFREDLFHRLNVIRIHLPRLSERREDIPALAKFFLGKAAKELGVEVKGLQPEAETMLAQLDWPGNVRQLENVCRWLTVMAPGRDIHVRDLPHELMEESHVDVMSVAVGWQEGLRSWAERELSGGHERLLDAATPVFERIMIEVALKHTAGRRREAADLLGWGRNTLTRKIKELDMFVGEEDEADGAP